MVPFSIWFRVTSPQNVTRHAISGGTSLHFSYKSCSVSSGGLVYSDSVNFPSTSNSSSSPIPVTRTFCTKLRKSSFYNAAVRKSLRKSSASFLRRLLRSLVYASSSSRLYIFGLLTRNDMRPHYRRGFLRAKIFIVPCFDSPVLHISM